VTFGNDGPKPDQLNSTEAVAKWVNNSVAKVNAAFADGFNIDFEHPIALPSDIKAITAFSKAAADAMHASNPHSHVTFDTPSEGLLGGSHTCGTQYNRNYDYKVSGLQV
jgi:hypothetical protein